MVVIASVWRGEPLALGGRPYMGIAAGSCHGDLHSEKVTDIQLTR